MASGDCSGGCPLVPNLHRALSARPARAQVSRAHFLGVVHREGHGLFLVDVLARIERRHEAFLVQMLRRGDQHRVDVRVLQHVVVVEISLGIGCDGFDGFQALGVDIGGADQFGILAAQRLAQDFRAAVAGPDNSKADALVRAQHVGRGQRTRQPGGHFADEIAP